MIKYCPNCANILSEDNKLAQGCKKCNACKGVYYILETTIPK